MRIELQPVIVGGVPQDANSEAMVRQQALVEHQGAVVRQLVDLEGRETSLRSSLARTSTNAERAQIQESLRDVERNLAGLKADLAETRAKLGGLTVEIAPPVGVPGELVPPPFVFAEDRMFGYTKDEFFGGVSFILLLPLVLAAARLVWRRGGVAARPRNTESDERLARLEQAVESVAIEVERIGESQRFTARLLSERQPEFNPATAGESARPAGDVRR